MHSTHLLLEEPIRMGSILEPSKANFFPTMAKIVGTLGPRSRSFEVISDCLKAGMTVARFDFSLGDAEYHQETLENLKTAIKSSKKLCAVMLDTVGAELQVVNKSETAITLKADENVILTPDEGQEASSEILPINFPALAKAVKKGDTIFIGQYLFTGSETTSVWLEVTEVKENDVVCMIKNSATLAGSLFTLHASQIHIDLPTLSEKDKQVISSWGVKNKIDFLSLSYTRHAEDVREAREFLSKLGDLSQTQIFAKIENVEGLTHFDEILEEADGIILSRGNLGIDLPPEKVFLFQKSAVYKCNMAGKPAVVTRVVDSMTDNLRPTRAEATDVANAVLDGCDAILLGAETLRGLYPVETISTNKSSLLLVLYVVVIVCSWIPLSHSSKKPVGAARKEDIPYIRCQVCEKLASQIYSQVEAKQAEISPKKISEYQVIEIAENVCNLKKGEADWILKIDIVEKGDKLELVEQDSEGQCNSECKTIERACQEILGYSDTDAAEYLYKKKPQLGSFINFVCKDLTEACSSKPPPVPKDRTPGEPFVAKSEKEAEMERLLKSMEGMPGAPGMKMYSREDLMKQNFGGEDGEDDDDDEDEADFPSNVGKVLRQKDEKKNDWKEKISKGIKDTGEQLKGHANRVSNKIRKWWQRTKTGSGKADL